MGSMAALIDKPRSRSNQRVNQGPTGLSSQDFIVQRFFSYHENMSLLHLYLKNKSPKHWNELKGAFSEFHFEVRFTKYLSSTIRYAYIDYERKRRKREERNPVILDKEIHEDDDRSLIDRYAIQPNQEQVRISLNPQVMLDSLANEQVHKAFSELSSKQKTILMFTYSMCYLDKEIAENMSISQQAVSKARKLALLKMRKRITGSDSRHDRREAN